MPISGKRFKSERLLEFGMMGRLIYKGKRESGTTQGYINLIKYAARCAVKEQGWEYADDKHEGVYVVITILKTPEVNSRKEEKKRKLAGEILPVCSPYSLYTANLILKALRGIVYANENQVVDLVVVKKYYKQDGLNILVGAPKDIKEMEHDVRNA